jgi:hypothetical protein
MLQKLSSIARIAITSAFMSLPNGHVAFAADITKAPINGHYVAPDQSLLIIYNQEFRYNTWDGNTGYPVTGLAGSGSGSQFYSPFALRVTARPTGDWQFESMARGGYVESVQRTPGQSGQYSGYIDTLVSQSVTYTGNPNFIPFLSLAANLPTGKSVLSGNQIFARMDPDIVDVATFGEGFNFGPTVGFTVPLGATRNVSFALGYTNRGSYTRDDAAGLATMEVSPSNHFTSTVQYRDKLGSLEYWGGLTYAWEDATTLTRPAFSFSVDPGNRLSIAAGASYAWTPRWQTTAQLAYTHIDENVGVVSTTGPVGIPGVNANPETYFASLEHRYGFASFAVGLRGSYLKRTANEFSPTLFNFIPAKEKWQLTAFATTPIASRLSLETRISRMWIDESADPALPSPDIRVDAWAFSLGASYAFQ